MTERAADLRRLTVDELVTRYLDAALTHSQATAVRDRAVANPAAQRIAAVYREIRRRGLDAQRALLPLVDHDDPGVRTWAATHALEFAPDEGEHALDEVASSASGFVRVDAATTLRLWRDGLLKLP